LKPSGPCAIALRQHVREEGGKMKKIKWRKRIEALRKQVGVREMNQERDESRER